MPERLIVVGGEVAGISAASQARRRRPADDLEILVFARSASVGLCERLEPSFVGHYVMDSGQWQARTPAEFAAMDIAVHTRHAVTGLDPAAGKVTVRNLEAGTDTALGYDLLMYAAGATALVPPIAGRHLAGVHALHSLDDALAVRHLVTWGVHHAVVIGGERVSLQVAETLHHHGVKTRVLTPAQAVLERTLDPDMGSLVTERLQLMGIEVCTGVALHSLDGIDGRVAWVDCVGGRRFEADMVVLGLETRPAVQLARDAGILLGETGAVAVNARQQTSIEGIWAAGACTETVHRVSQRAVHVPPGTIATQQGQVAGINIGGEYATFPGVVGTTVTRVCDLEIARTGLTEAEASAAGFGYHVATIDNTSTAGYWSEDDNICIKILAEWDSGRLLGAQIVGGWGAGKRIDLLATALCSNMRVDELVWDPVLVAVRRVWESSR